MIGYLRGVKVTVVGSADAFNASGRGNSCYLVEGAHGARLMIDFGPTALLGLRRLGVLPTDIGALALTHLHGDHVGGFPALIIDGLYNVPRTAALSVLGPVLTKHTLGLLLDTAYGIALDAVTAFPLGFDELVPGEARTLAGFEIRGFAADHMSPPHRPLCLRVTDPSGKSVAFSGDTRFCPGLLEAAEGADLLVAEYTRLAHPAGHHCTWEEWTSRWSEVRARALLLTHLGADVRERSVELQSTVNAPLPLRFADDGLEIEV